MPFYWDIDNFDADIVQASLDSQVIYKYVCRWTIDKAFIVIVAIFAVVDIRFDTGNHSFIVTLLGGKEICSSRYGYKDCLDG